MRPRAVNHLKPHPKNTPRTTPWLTWSLVTEEEATETSSVSRNCACVCARVWRLTSPVHCALVKCRTPRYDNLVMEEAAQVLEVETVIPMLLQPSHDGALGGMADDGDDDDGGFGGGSGKTAGCRLQVNSIMPVLQKHRFPLCHAIRKDSNHAPNSNALTFAPTSPLPLASCRSPPMRQRVCLIGDHHQLPPVVKNLALQKYGQTRSAACSCTHARALSPVAAEATERFSTWR